MVSVLRGGAIRVCDFILWPKEIPQFSKEENSNFRFNLKVLTDCINVLQYHGVSGLQFKFLLTGYSSYSSSQTSSMSSLTLVCSAVPEMIE